jgi:hypothetical protein
MFDYVRYLLNPAIMAVSAYGLWLGGDYTWLGFGLLIGILMLDCFLPLDLAVRDQRFPWLYDTVVSFQIIVSFAQIFFYVWLIGNDHFTTTSSMVGAFISMMFVQFVVGAPALHEMFHREARRS